MRFLDVHPVIVPIESVFFAFLFALIANYVFLPPLIDAAEYGIFYHKISIHTTNASNPVNASTIPATIESLSNLPRFASMIAFCFSS